ncbi:jg17898 [Pararge aegeria aegeria]|uniref:Jg17898 protein n=1 Tax=Pararge aegeria aegeria TaxID=348720 RepID=A0A8S4SLZ6_9NEOP|nr:jg17898 [Pararge aegeria aegeria]
MFRSGDNAVGRTRLPLSGGRIRIPANSKTKTLVSYVRLKQLKYHPMVKENLGRKPACLRVLLIVLKGVWSPPIRTGPAWWTTALLPLLNVEGDPYRSVGR